MRSAGGAVMQDGVPGERCLWPVEGGECGKPAVGEAAAVDPASTPAFRIAVCQEHLDQSRRGAAADDPA